MNSASEKIMKQYWFSSVIERLLCATRHSCHCTILRRLPFPQALMGRDSVDNRRVTSPVRLSTFLS